MAFSIIIGSRCPSHPWTPSTAFADDERELSVIGHEGVKGMLLEGTADSAQDTAASMWLGFPQLEQLGPHVIGIASPRS